MDVNRRVEHRSEQSNSPRERRAKRRDEGDSNGKSVANSSLAINEPFREEDGKQRVEWVRCAAWDKLAQVAERFVAKGTIVFLKGRLQTRNFEDLKAMTNTVTEVVVTSLGAVGRSPRVTPVAQAPQRMVVLMSMLKAVPF